MDRPNSPSQAPGAELRVGYPAIRRFALHTALWVAILVVPAAALVYIASQRSDSVYLAEATLMAPTGTFATEALVDTPVATRPLAPRAYHAALGSVDVLSAALVTLGADPVATSMLHATAAKGDRLDAFVVRKAGTDSFMQPGGKLEAGEDGALSGAQVAALTESATAEMAGSWSSAPRSCPAIWSRRACPTAVGTAVPWNSMPGSSWG